MRSERKLVLHPADLLTHPEADRLKPPGCHVRRKLVDGAWGGRFASGRTLNRSWNKYGSQEALRLVTIALWTRYCYMEGLTPSECPAEGIFPAIHQASPQHVPEYDAN